MNKKTIFYGLSLITGLGFASLFIFADHINPQLITGNGNHSPSCQDLGYQYEFKIDPPNDGTYYLPGNTGSVTITNVSQGIFNWSSTFGIDAVIVKGGPNANLYEYDPPSESFGDNNLSTPINPNNGKPYGLSHVSFCYDVDKLIVEKNSNNII